MAPGKWSAPAATAVPLLVLLGASPSRSCHVVFVPASEMSHFREISASLGNLSVLLAGETEGFAARAA
jgi:uncharacterized protein DUF4154